MTALDDVVTDDHPGSAERDAWTCAFDPEEGGAWGLHRHDQHQLVWTAAGSARAVAGGRSWVLPPSRALFVPGGVPHDVVLRPPAALHCLYVWPHACPLPWTRPTVVAVSDAVSVTTAPCLVAAFTSFFALSKTASETVPTLARAKPLTCSTPCCTTGVFHTLCAASLICSYRLRPARVPST